jgi:hypothetical protein
MEARFVTASRRGRQWASHAGLRLVAGAALLVLFVGPAILPSTYLSQRDIRRLHLPLRHFLSAELSHGRLPTWYPFDGIGSSFVGSAVGAPLSPLQLLVFGLAPDAALKLQILLLLVLAGAGMARLVAGLGASEPFRWAAAVAYAGSGYLLSGTDNFTFLHGAAVLPWAVDAAERLARSPSLRRGLWCGLVLALGLAGGDVQSTYLQALLCLAWVCIQSRPLRKALVSLLLGWLVAGLLLVPIVPSIAVTAVENGRVHGLRLDEALDWSLHPIRLLELPIGPLAPAGLADEAGPRIGPVLAGRSGAPWATSEYLGILFTVFFLIGLFDARRERLGRYAFVALAALLLALGGRGGLYPIFWRIFPLWSSFRYPEKLMPFLLLGAGVIATRAIQTRTARSGPLVLPLLSAACLLLLIAAVAGPDPVSSVLGGLPADLAARVSTNVRVEAVLAAVLLAAFALVLRKWPERAPWAAVAVVVIQGAFCGGGQVVVRAREELQRAPMLLEALRASGADRTRIASWPSRYSFGRDPPPYKEAVQEAEWQALVPDLSGLASIANIYPYTPGTAAALEGACGTTPSCTSSCARRLGARLCIVSFDEVPRIVSRGAREVTSISRPKLSLLADPFARPWASVPGVRSVPDEAAASLAMRQDGPDLRAIAIQAVEAPGEPGAVLSWTRPRPDEALVEVDLASDNLVVLAENCARGWHVDVDGVPRAPERVDLALCGVRVGLGRHTVHFRYVPPGWPLGLWVPLAGLGLAVVLWRRPR